MGAKLSANFKARATGLVGLGCVGRIEMHQKCMSTKREEVH